MDKKQQDKQSIARKLSRSLTRRMLGSMLLLDIVLVLAFFAVTAAVCERAAADGGASAVSDGQYGRFYGLHLDSPLGKVFPEKTRNGYRGYQIGGTALYDAGKTNVELIRFSYVVSYESGGEYFRAERDLSPAFAVAANALAALIIFELLHCLRKSHANRRLVRRMLAPISDFASAAGTLSHMTKSLNPREISELSGTLDGINASQLDTRIDLGGTQGELRELAAAINDMLDRLEDAYAAQIRFVSDASHELRTPIAVIGGYAGLLDRWGKNDPKTLQEGIDAIKNESESMKKLVERLLFLAKGDSGTLKMSPTEFDLAELASETLDEFKMIDAEHEFGLAAETAVVTADRLQIKEALRVIMDNAVKYTDAGGNIKLHSGVREDGSAVLEVSDTGQGISAEDLPRVFDRFVRTDASRNRESGGAGLGLAIAKRIAAASGGHIEAVSRPGIGTRMTIVFKTESFA